MCQTAEVAAVDPGAFMTRAEAMSLLGLNGDQLSRLLKSGAVTVRRIPGTRPRLLRSDVERLARESIVPAKASA